MGVQIPMTPRQPPTNKPMVTHTHIDYDEYMTTLAGKVKKIELGKPDLYHFGELLDYETKNGEFSTYKIYSYLKKRQAYKNIHQKTQKLFSLGLIEEVKGDYSHGAKFYKLSIRGWFNIIMNDFHYIELQRAIMKFYDKNIFFKTLLSPYFEFKTVEYYITKLHSPDFSYYLVDCCKSTSVLYNFPDLDLEKVKVVKSMAIAGLDIVVKSFLTKILMNAVFNDTHFSSSKELSILSDDKKFLEALKNTKIDFEKSYDILTSKKRRAI